MPARLILLLVFLLGTAAPLYAQNQPVVLDTSKVIPLGPVVVTATRTAKALEDVAVPTTIITAQKMEVEGAVRLGEVLESVTGLGLFDDHGSGIQVQGFAPDYTLILLDGEPIIGRTAGTLDLDRLTVSGLERVEIVRGPSSSLYGSEALAGVINLVTQTPLEGRSASLRTRYGSHDTADLAATLEAGNEQFGARVLFNRYSSGGYDLTPDVFGPTTPNFTDYTADARLRAALSDNTTLRLGARLAVQDQASEFALSAIDGGMIPHDQREDRTDWSIHPEIQQRLSRKLQATGSLYAARYQTGTDMTRRDDGSRYFTDSFDQRYGKAEIQFDALWSAKHLSSLGGGYIQEQLGGDRYADAEPEAQTAFLFGQHEWIPSRLLTIGVSARFDAHSDYAARLSPKASLLVRPSEKLRFRASVGSGFKAPAFRQLYLVFTNAAAGYSVFGATQVQEGLDRLQEEGQITEVFLDPSSFAAIEAESSIAFNAGFTAEPFDGLTVQANGFYNNVHDLIDTQPVAQKTNGSFVYSYFNLERIYTRGVETEITVQPLINLTLTGGYQWLQARDRNVVDAIQDGSVFGRRENGRDYRLTLRDYQGLFGRSPHTGTLRATYALPEHRFTASVRARWRSRYGYRDVDGNNIPNRDDEFVDAYGVWDLTLTKSWAFPIVELLSLQLGVDNVLNVTRPSLIPSLPGRTLYAGLAFQL